MIFCESPVNDKPGGMPDFMTQDYNANVRALTAKFAPRSWATNPPSLWREEATHHFKKNGNAILKAVEGWVRDEQGNPGSNYSCPSMMGAHAVDLAVELPELHKALQRYGSTYTPRRVTQTVR